MTLINGTQYPEVIGLIPAAGHASRIAPLPCSKELYPIGFREVKQNQGLRPKTACHYLLEKMRLAGITTGYIVLGTGKWDIPAYLGDGTLVDMHLAYLVINSSPSVPLTLDQAYPFSCNSQVAFGFPDILFQSDNAYTTLLARQTDTGSDLVLGLFPCEQSDKVDMVDLDGDGRAREIVIRPRRTHLRYSWCVAVWTPVFTQFLHDHVAARQTSAVTQPELSVGEVIQAAIRQGLGVGTVQISDEPYLDIGTSADLVKAVRRFAGR